ncbi:MAG: SDR family NAD(P)-dependent oxidoreductase [bacterium]|nr:SDR family NAD(P)-dependent oxidoreductase [bacterium]
MFIKKEVTICKGISEVFNYVLNFSHLFEWDDHVIEGQRIDLGPIKVGSKFSFLYSIAGSLQKIEYTIESIETNNFLRFRCDAPAFRAIDEISFKSKGMETLVTYQADINVRNKIKDYIFSPFMDRIGNRVVARLKAALETPEIITSQGRDLSLLNLPYRFSSKGWNYRRKNFSATKICPKTVLITGSTSGLGKSAAVSLAGMGCNLILMGRNSNKLEQLKNDLKERGFDRNLYAYTCDMEDISRLKTVCEQVIKDGHKIDVLINNAGALFPEAKLLDGTERTTVVDLIAPWVITCKLLAIIQPKGCIINVSSGGIYSAKLTTANLKKATEPFSGSKAYAAAKRAMNIFSAGLNSELKDMDIRVHCMHPGWADTPGVVNSLPTFHKLSKHFLRTPFQGADTLVWLAMHNPESGGKFWLDRQIQPSHIFNSTKIEGNEYEELRSFLDPFSKPNLNREFS